MSPVFDVLVGLCSSAGGIGGLSAFLYTRSSTVRRDAAAQLLEHSEVKTTANAAQALAQELKAKGEHRDEEIAQLRSEVARAWQKLSVLDSKMEVFWKNVALDVASVLHSPHEGWQSLDRLLEKFRDETITPDEMKELVGVLGQVKDGAFQPPVSRADQVAASLLLRAIESTRGTHSAGKRQE